VLAEPEIAGCVAVDIGLDIPEFADGVISAARKAGKPLVACAVDAAAVEESFRAAGVAVYPTPERAIRAYRGLWRSTLGPQALARASVRPVLRIELESILDSAHGPMPYDVARELLAAYGVRFCREMLVESDGEALGAARKIGFPVVVKTARADVIHKTEAGAVIAGVRDVDQLRAACRSIAGRVGSAGFLIQEQIAPGAELLLGGRRDESFGPVVLVGTGGFLAEAVRDVSLALAPVSLEAALELVPLGLRGRLVSGYRGWPPWEPGLVAGALVAIGRVLVDHSRIREIDVNPLIARGTDAIAVDALVVLD
jgi:acyl-CoA synthetase (NDP forming)